MNPRIALKSIFPGAAFLLFAFAAAAQTPATTLLVVEKAGTQLAIVDPVSLKILATAPAGADPHEVVASPDGKLAFISNYGGPQSSLHTISVVDLVALQPLPAIDLGLLHGCHGLFIAGGDLYFTAEVNKVIGRYDLASQKIDWILGIGENRTHMVWVAPTLDTIVTSNVISSTISIVDHTQPPRPPNAPGGPPPGPPPAGSAPRNSAPPAGGPPSGGPRQRLWSVTDIPVGKGSEGFDVSPDGKEIWSAAAYDGTVSVIDFAAKKVTDTFPISVISANRLRFTPDGKLVLITGSGAPARGSTTPTPDLVVVDVAKHAEIKQFDLGGSSGGILMSPDGSRAFVSVTGGNKVVVIDLKSLTISTEITPLGQPDGLAWAVRN
jgi:YVTN family beta-propeller protein